MLVFIISGGCVAYRSLLLALLIAGVTSPILHLPLLKRLFWFILFTLLFGYGSYHNNPEHIDEFKPLLKLLIPVTSLMMPW